MAEALNALYGSAVFLSAATGLAIVFGLMGVINLAHGEFLMLGAYVALVVTEATSHFWLGLLIAPIAVALISLPIERVLMRRFYARPLETIVVTAGLAIVLQQLVNKAFGSEFRRIPSPLPGSFSLLGATFPRYRLLVIAVAFAVVLALWTIQRRTLLGLRARAVMQNPQLADGLGIDTGRAYQVTFAVGSALAGLAGALIAPTASVFPGMGTPFVISAFLVVLVGGLGSLGGMTTAAVLLGVTQSVLSGMVTPVAGLIGVVACSVIFMRILPEGLAGLRLRPRRPLTRATLA